MRQAHGRPRTRQSLRQRCGACGRTVARHSMIFSHSLRIFIHVRVHAFFLLHLGRHGPVQSFSDRVTYINSSYWNPQIALCV